MPFGAMTQQIGSDGRIAGRIFLPTAETDPNGYYTHPFSPLRDGPTAGSLLWEWRDLGGPPVVTPGEAAVAPPSGGGLTEDQVQAMIDRAIADCVKVGDKIALRCSGDGTAEGQVLCAEGGGPHEQNQPVVLTGRVAVGPWESFRIEEGQ